MMLPTKDEKSCLLFSTKMLSSVEKKIDHCAGVFGSGHTGKLAFTDLSAKPDPSMKDSDEVILDGWFHDKTTFKKYESDIYHYLCNCPVHSPSIFSNNVNFIYADSLTQVANTAHECNLNSLEYFDEIEEPDCNFPSHLGDDKIQFVCAMDFETTETTKIPETSTKTIATTESFKALKAELAKLETVTKANVIKTSSDPYS